MRYGKFTAVKEPYIDEEHYASFTDAVAAAVAGGKTLEIGRVISITNGLIPSNEIPSTVSLRFMRDGKFTIASGVTLTIKGPVMSDHDTWWDGSGTVVIDPQVGKYFFSSIHANSGIMSSANTINVSTTIPAGVNSLSVGPITVANGVTVTVADNAVWTIL